MQAVTLVYIQLKKLQNNESVSPLHLFVSGGAGTGKPYVINVIRHLIMHYSDGPPVVVAPTGIVACNISGRTIHSALQVNVATNRQVQHDILCPKLSGQKLAMLREQWRTVQWLIVDEISMVSNYMWLWMHQRLCIIKDTLVTVLFGGINVICVGDLYQISPVRGQYVFEAIGNDATLDDRRNQLVKVALWHQTFQMLELDENVRQSGDLSYAAMLNRIRIGAITDDDYEQLKSRRYDPEGGTAKQSDFLSAIHLFSHRADVDEWNGYKLQLLSERALLYPRPLQQLVRYSMHQLRCAYQLHMQLNYSHKITANGYTLQASQLQSMHV
jgi:ATP-dependent DNA helicase PIF1